MATTLVTLSRTLVIGGKLTQSTDQAVGAETVAISAPQTYTHGTGANQANADWAPDEQSAAGSADTHDLAGGLTDHFGNTLTFTSVKELYIKNESTTAGENLTLTGSFLDAAFAAGGTFTDTVGPGGVFLRASPLDGFTVTAATGDVISVDPGSDTIAYRMYILGVI